jgi:hypothetical protein
MPDKRVGLGRTEATIGGPAPLGVAPQRGVAEAVLEADDFRVHPL